MAKRDLSIDFLRAVCILYIVGFWHLVPYTQSYSGYANFITEGIKDSALGIFVFCSGYLLALREPRLSAAGLREFYQRRLLRIYPLYALALVLFAWLGLGGSADLLQAALLVSMFAPPAPYTLWFITMIMFFYVLAPYLIRLANKVGWYLLVVGALFFMIVLYHLYVRPTDVRMLMFLPAFAFGIGFAREAGLQALLRRYRFIGVLLLLPSYWLFAQQQGDSLSSALGRIPLVLNGTAVAFLYAAPVAARFWRAGISWLSYTSFGLYLFHRVVFDRVLEWYFPSEPLARLLYLLGVVLPLALLVAYVIQRLYDHILGAVTSKA